MIIIVVSLADFIGIPILHFNRDLYGIPLMIILCKLVKYLQRLAPTPLERGWV